MTKKSKLRAVAPEAVQKRLKALFYGNAGAGKTTAALGFPKVYLIDTERGAENSQYTRLLAKNGGVIFQSTDFDEVMKEVTLLLTEDHDFKTLVIDPLTNLFNDLVDKCAVTVGTEFGRHYAEANKRMKHLCSLLLRLDMNVIITSHSKTEYGTNMTVIGQTFDGYKKLDYLFDLVLEIQKRGSDHVALVKKSRIEGIITNEAFDFSYDELANRYGRDVLERDAVPEDLATPEQVEEITALVFIQKVSADVVKKWLDKSNAETFAEMPRDSIQKCIDYLAAKEPKPEPKPTEEVK